MSDFNIFDLFQDKCISGSTVAVIYDAYSSAWQVSLLFLKKALEEGYFGVMSNYSVPLRGLFRRGRSVGLDFMEALQNGNLAVIDVFGSRYASTENLPGVFYLDKVEPETINPKIDRIYWGPLRMKVSSGKIIRLVYTLDGAAMMLGEENTLKLLNQTVATKSVRFPDSILLLPVNSDIVSKRFVAWTSTISDYVVLARSWIEKDYIKELLYIIKSPCADFEPVTYSLRVTGDKEKIYLKKVLKENLNP
ncbi:hypothetical protein APY94_08360 [Thermococcus celericrescens]|uniref:KaiC-like domain-containing protein n=2 Tax=Thermococcus TaxID=2263 RepID=A0A100XWY2_9EURY|nr:MULTISPECIES: hypothetical protein [Thermococcus]KUH32789.1 hypothetical protein APY94_08360 [Thermococcus celericrescens]QEK14456.1 hypothetical protein FPV09_04315 [Thermococcus aciditolerans]